MSALLEVKGLSRFYGSLKAVDDIRGLEEEKREAEMSTPQFHELADRIAARARDVFGYANDERDTGDELSRRQSMWNRPS